MPNAKFKHYLHLHFIVFIWGFTAILGELISIDAIPLVWYRMGLAALLMILYIRYKKFDLTVNRKQLLLYVLGGIIIALHWITFFYAIKISNISIALASMSTGAFFTVFIEAVYKKRKIIFYEFLFGVLAILGLYIIYKSAIALQIGILFALISSFLSALFSVLNADFVKDNKPAVISFYEILSGVVVISAYLLYNGDLLTARFYELQPTDYLWLFILSSVCTAYAFIASVDLLKRLTPFTVMLTINLEPIYAIVLAVLIFPEKEKMSPTFYLGGAIILITVVVNGIIKTMKKRTTILKE